MIEPAILAELWQTHSTRLLIIARSVGQPAEDAVQEAFTSLAIQEQLPDDPVAWLARTVRNWLISSQRKQKSQSLYCEAIQQQETWFSAAPAHQVDSMLDGQEVTKWLKLLPSDERQVIAMHLWGNMTFRQIATTIDCSPATANRLYHNGIETLRNKANVQNEVCYE